jgi:glycosyltransferase involved in cell wall biosynthesis
VVVVDNDSTDGTFDLAIRLADHVISAGPERSRQRNVGARSVDASVLVFVDSDMMLERTVLAEVEEAIRDGAGAVIVPERTVGHGFFARVRQYERSYYGSDTSIEAARGFSASIFESVGGFDEQLTGPEDWDLTIRVRAKAPIFRAKAGAVHDEGRVRFLDACRRKAYYAEGLRRFARKHGRTGIGLAIDRPWLRRPWTLLYPHPLLGLGVLALKLGEVTAVTYTLLKPTQSAGIEDDH